MKTRVLNAMALALVAAAVACVTPAHHPPAPPVQPPPAERYVVRTVRDAQGEAIQAGAVRLWDDAQHEASCAWRESRLFCQLTPAMANGTGYTLAIEADGQARFEARAVFHFTPESPVFDDQGELNLGPSDPPIASKEEFFRNYQGAFGGIKLAGCGLHLDNLFDPFLLIKYLEDRPCYERMMAEHAIRNDNRIVVDPRSGYHGHNDVDVWHQPDVFTEFIRDVRRHTNAKGEHFAVQVFMAGDGHIPSFLDGRQPNAEAEAHWRADVDALAAAAEPYVDATVVCWECRHQTDYMTAGTYERNGQYLAQKFPRAAHLQHLIVGSSSWSSWRCDPDQVFDGQAAWTLPDSDKRHCNQSEAQLDDPNRGNEPMAWTRCTQAGWCDGLLYQFHTGYEFLYPETAEKNYTGFPGALGRWFEIVARMGNDPWSAATAHGDRHGWVQTNVIAFEFIFDNYWNTDPKASEAYLKDWCQRALAMGGWGCGTGSYRRP